LKKSTSLKHILKTISKVLGIPVQFVSDCVGEEAENAAANLKAGEVLFRKSCFHIGRRSRRCYFAKRISVIRRYLCK
jgi:phosphoglycerate kinase